MMIEHAPDLLQFSFWVISVLGILIVSLFGLGLSIVRWAVKRYEDGTAEAQRKLNERLDQQDETLKSIKDFMAKELYELREWFHRLDKDVLVLREREQRYGQQYRHDDFKHGTD
jgi:ABC-type multidrug transport system fused ATPase/permease subunit